MEYFIPYLLKAVLCTMGFYLFFKTTLSNETFFGFNRAILLVGVFVCTILPFIQIDIETTHQMQAPFVELEYFISPDSPNKNLIPQDTNSIINNSTINWTIILLTIYIGGLIITIIRLLCSFYSMARLIRSGDKKEFGEYTLVITDRNISPFSWQKYIVISAADYRDNPDEIICHELSHIKHRHSWDLLYIEIVALIQWFNPAIWLLKRELKDIHEYQADINVLKSGIDATKYQLLLVKKAVGASSYTLANSFNHSKIKKRITMMLKEKSNSWARFKLILVLPLAILSVYAFARPEMKDVTTPQAHDKNTILLSDVDKNEVKSETAKNQERQTPQKADTKYQRDSAHTAITDYIEENGFKDPQRIGKPPKGKFKLLSMTYLSDMQNNCTIYPMEYNPKGDDKEENYKKIYWYIIDGKKYHWGKFIDVCHNGKVYFEREKLRPEYGKVIEVGAITTDGATTPNFYMVIPK